MDVNSIVKEPVGDWQHISQNGEAEGGLVETTVESTTHVKKVEARGGEFYITDSEGNVTRVDLATLLMLLNLDAVANLDKQISEKLAVMNERNNMVSQMTEYMSYMNRCKNEGMDDNNQYLTIDGETRTLNGTSSWAEKFGIEGAWSNVDGTRDGSKNKDSWGNAWDANIKALQGKVDMANNDSQQDNIMLQNLLDKRSNAFSFATNSMAGQQKNKETVLANMR